MRRIVVHAGPGKTGTSVVQQALLANSEALRSRGVLYPVHRMGSNLISSGNRDVLLERSPQGQWQVSPQRVDRLLEEFERSDCHTLLLSSEFFFRRLKALAAALPTAEFVLYFRNPVDMRQSGYVQNVKRGRFTQSFRMGPKEVDDQFKWFRNLLENDLKQRLHIRPYARELFAGGNILKDLLSVVDVVIPVSEPPQINTSYTFEALEFKRHANHLALGRLDAKLDIALQACDLGQSEYYLMGPEQVEALQLHAIDALERFIAEMCQPQLLPLVSQMAKSTTRPCRRQDDFSADLKMIARYVARKAPLLYLRLRRMAGKSCEGNRPSDAFFRAMGLRAPKRPG